MNRRKLRVLSVFGTRPEAIKMAPVVLELERRTDQFESVVCLTGQHREMLDQVMTMFGISGDFDLALMKQNQDLFDVTVGVVRGVANVLAQCQPDVVLVHGDTTSTFGGALAAYYAGVPVGHVEAGLRTADKFEPYPEEMNRRLCDALCDVYFAPTQHNAKNLIREGTVNDRIFVTGNTVIDALLRVLPAAKDQTETITGLEAVDWSRRNVLVTMHRRESLGRPIESICRAVRRICLEVENVNVIFPMHRNPKVRASVERILQELDNCFLIEPLEYLPFIAVMDKSHLILTDSGGIQEEAPSLDKPVLVVRNKTERFEAVESGAVRVIGTKTERVFSEVKELLQNPEAYWEMAKSINPYGDGRAAIRIANALQRIYGREIILESSLKLNGESRSLGVRG